MRKQRLLFWLISFVLCVVVITIYKEKENEIPYEERTPINVCCEEEYQEYFKGVIEASSLGETNRVVFTDSKQNAEFVITDKISKSDKGYEKIAWTPLVVAIDDTTKNKIKSYEVDGYLTKTKKGIYTIYFDKIIEATIEGNWKDKIFCPKLDTREGEIFFDFLLVNINDGKYPKNEEEMQKCKEKAEQFLNSSVVVEANVKEKLKNKRIVENELYILFESDVYQITSSSENVNYDISYPSNTVLLEWYWGFFGINAEKLENIMLNTSKNVYKIKDHLAFALNDLRTEAYSGYQERDYISDSDGFSYVDIPLKEE